MGQSSSKGKPSQEESKGVESNESISALDIINILPILTVNKGEYEEKIGKVQNITELEKKINDENLTDVNSTHTVLNGSQLQTNVLTGQERIADKIECKRVKLKYIGRSKSVTGNNGSFILTNKTNLRLTTTNTGSRQTVGGVKEGRSSVLTRKRFGFSLHRSMSIRKKKNRSKRKKRSNKLIHKLDKTHRQLQSCHKINDVEFCSDIEEVSDSEDSSNEIQIQNNESPKYNRKSNDKLPYKDDITITSRHLNSVHDKTNLTNNLPNIFQIKPLHNQELMFNKIHECDIETTTHQIFNPNKGPENIPQDLKIENKLNNEENPEYVDDRVQSLGRGPSFFSEEGRSKTVYSLFNINEKELLKNHEQSEKFLTEQTSLSAKLSEDTSDYNEETNRNTEKIIYQNVCKTPSDNRQEHSQIWNNSENNCGDTRTEENICRDNFAEVDEKISFCNNEGLYFSEETTTKSDNIHLPVNYEDHTNSMFKSRNQVGDDGRRSEVSNSTSHNIQLEKKVDHEETFNGNVGESLVEIEEERNNEKPELKEENIDDTTPNDIEGGASVVKNVRCKDAEDYNTNQPQLETVNYSNFTIHSQQGPDHNEITKGVKDRPLLGQRQVQIEINSWPEKIYQHQKEDGCNEADNRTEDWSSLEKSVIHNEGFKYNPLLMKERHNEANNSRQGGSEDKTLLASKHETADCGKHLLEKEEVNQEIHCSDESKPQIEYINAVEIHVKKTEAYEDTHSSSDEALQHQTRDYKAPNYSEDMILLQKNRRHETLNCNGQRFHSQGEGVPNSATSVKENIHLFVTETNHNGTFILSNEKLQRETIAPQNKTLDCGNDSFQLDKGKGVNYTLMRSDYKLANIGVNNDFGVMQSIVDNAENIDTPTSHEERIKLEKEGSYETTDEEKKLSLSKNEEHGITPNIGDYSFLVEKEGEHDSIGTYSEDRLHVEMHPKYHERNESCTNKIKLEKNNRFNDAVKDRIKYEKTGGIGKADNDSENFLARNVHCVTIKDNMDKCQVGKNEEHKEKFNDNEGRLILERSRHTHNLTPENSNDDIRLQMKEKCNETSNNCENRRQVTNEERNNSENMCKDSTNFLDDKRIKHNEYNSNHNLEDSKVQETSIRGRVELQTESNGFGETSIILEAYHRLFISERKNELQCKETSVIKQEFNNHDEGTLNFTESEELEDDILSVVRVDTGMNAFVPFGQNIADNNEVFVANKSSLYEKSFLNKTAICNSPFLTTVDSPNNGKKNSMTNSVLEKNKNSFAPNTDLTSDTTYPTLSFSDINTPMRESSPIEVNDPQLDKHAVCQGRIPQEYPSRYGNLTVKEIKCVPFQMKGERPSRVTEHDDNDKIFVASTFLPNVKHASDLSPLNQTEDNLYTADSSIIDSRILSTNVGHDLNILSLSNTIVHNPLTHNQPSTLITDSEESSDSCSNQSEEELENINEKPSSQKMIQVGHHFESIDKDSPFKIQKTRNRLLKNIRCRSFESIGESFDFRNLEKDDRELKLVTTRSFENIPEISLVPGMQMDEECEDEEFIKKKRCVSGRYVNSPIEFHRNRSNVEYDTSEKQFSDDNQHNTSLYLHTVPTHSKPLSLELKSSASSTDTDSITVIENKPNKLDRVNKTSPANSSDIPNLECDTYVGQYNELNEKLSHARYPYLGATVKTKTEQQLHLNSSDIRYDKCSTVSCENTDRAFDPPLSTTYIDETYKDSGWFSCEDKIDSLPLNSSIEKHNPVSSQTGNDRSLICDNYIDNITTETNHNSFNNTNKPRPFSKESSLKSYYSVDSDIYLTDTTDSESESNTKEYAKSHLPNKVNCVLNNTDIRRTSSYYSEAHLEPKDGVPGDEEETKCVSEVTDTGITDSDSQKGNESVSKGFGSFESTSDSDSQVSNQRKDCIVGTVSEQAAVCKATESTNINKGSVLNQNLRRDYNSCEDISLKNGIRSNLAVSKMLHRSRPDLIKGISTQSQEGLPSTSSQSYSDISGLSQSTSENSLHSTGSAEAQRTNQRSQRTPASAQSRARPRPATGVKTSDGPGPSGASQGRGPPPLTRKLSTGDTSGSSTPTQSIIKKKEAKRSQIVAAVTTRLYDTRKKPDPKLEALQAEQAKEEDDDDGEPDELKLCKRARMKLFDLSRKLALANKKFKKTADNDTQTEYHLGTIRLKEKSIGTDQQGILQVESSSTNTPHDKELKDNKKDNTPIIMNQIFIPQSADYVVECGKGIRVQVPAAKTTPDTSGKIENPKTFKDQSTSPIKKNMKHLSERPSPFSFSSDESLSDDSLELESRKRNVQKRDNYDLDSLEVFDCKRPKRRLAKNSKFISTSNENLSKNIFPNLQTVNPVLATETYRSYDSLVEGSMYGRHRLQVSTGSWIERSALPITRYSISGTNMMYEYNPNKNIPDVKVFGQINEETDKVVSFENVSPEIIYKQNHPSTNEGLSSNPKIAEDPVTLFNGLPIDQKSQECLVTPVEVYDNYTVVTMKMNEFLRNDNDNCSSDNSFMSNSSNDLTSSTDTSSEDFIFYEAPKDKDLEVTNSLVVPERELYTISENSEPSEHASSDASSPRSRSQDETSIASIECRSDQDLNIKVMNEQQDNSSSLRDGELVNISTTTGQIPNKEILIKVVDKEEVKEKQGKNCSTPDLLAETPTTSQEHNKTVSVQSNTIEIVQTEENTKHKLPPVCTKGKNILKRNETKIEGCNSKTNWSELYSNTQRQYLNINILGTSKQSPYSIETQLCEALKKENGSDSFPSEDSITFVFLGPAKQKTSVLMELIRRSLNQRSSSSDMSQSGKATQRKSRSRGIQCTNLPRSISIDTAMMAISRFASNHHPSCDIARTISLDTLIPEETQRILEQGRLHTFRENSCQCNIPFSNLDLINRLIVPTNNCPCKLQADKGCANPADPAKKDQETETLIAKCEIETQTKEEDLKFTISASVQTRLDIDSIHVPCPSSITSWSEPEDLFEKITIELPRTTTKPQCKFETEEPENHWQEMKELILGYNGDMFPNYSKSDSIPKRPDEVDKQKKCVSWNDTPSIEESVSPTDVPASPVLKPIIKTPVVTEKTMSDVDSPSTPNEYDTAQTTLEIPETALEPPSPSTPQVYFHLGQEDCSVRSHSTPPMSNHELKQFLVHDQNKQPNSLDSSCQTRRVRFSEPQRWSLMDVRKFVSQRREKSEAAINMSAFLKEATLLLKNLNQVSEKLDKNGKTSLSDRSEKESRSMLISALENEWTVEDPQDALESQLLPPVKQKGSRKLPTVKIENELHGTNKKVSDERSSKSTSDASSESSPIKKNNGNIFSYNTDCNFTWPRRKASKSSGFKTPSVLQKPPLPPMSTPLQKKTPLNDNSSSKLSSCSTNWNFSNLSTTFSNSYIGESRPNSARLDYDRKFASNSSLSSGQPPISPMRSPRLAWQRLPLHYEYDNREMELKLEESCRRLELAVERDKLRQEISSKRNARQTSHSKPRILRINHDDYLKDLPAGWDEQLVPSIDTKHPENIYFPLIRHFDVSHSENGTSCSCNCHRFLKSSKVKRRYRSCLELSSAVFNKHCHACCITCPINTRRKYYSTSILNESANKCSYCNNVKLEDTFEKVRLRQARTSPRAYMQHLLTLRKQIIDASRIAGEFSAQVGK